MRAGLVRLVVLAALAAAASLVGVAGTAPAAAATASPAKGVTIYLFWGEGCPHCAALRPFLDELATPAAVELRAYEVFEDAGNRDRFARVAAAHGTEASAVPTVFVGGRSWVGDSDVNRAAIRETVEACDGGGCPDVAGAVLRGTEPPPPESPGTRAADADETAVDVPLVGRHDVGGDSLVWATALIAFADGFNPCSLWVLTVLLAMVLRTGSRSRLALIGGSYLVTAAAVYGVFLAGLFGALTVVEYSWWLRGGVAAFALAFAAVNVKDYFRFGRGLSLTIPERAKPRIARRSRSLALERRRLPLVVGLAAGLAAGVSLLELPCTAGFPVVWSNLLAERGTTDAEFAGLLAVYLTIFLLDELVVFGVAVTAMRVGRVEERHGRVLKLAGGILMALLAVVMLVAPDLLERPTGAGGVFAAAATLTAAVLVLDRGGRSVARSRAGLRRPEPRLGQHG